MSSGAWGYGKVDREGEGRPSVLYSDAAAEKMGNKNRERQIAFKNLQSQIADMKKSIVKKCLR